MAELNYNIINTKDGLDAFSITLNNLSEYVFDLECTSLATHSEEIRLVGIGFCWEEGVGHYIPFNGVLTEDEIIEAIRPSLENETIRKIGHNFKFDARLMNRFGIDVKCLYFDTMVASFCLYGDRLKHNLDDLVLHHINHIKVRTKTLIPKKSKKNATPSMMDCDLTQVGIYCCEDVDYSWRLFKVFHKLLNLPEHSIAKKLFYEVDMPLVSVLTKIECQGIKLDKNKLHELRDIVSGKLVILQKDIDVMAGRELSLTRPADIGACLYVEQKVQEKLGVTVPKTGTGQYSTAAATLETLNKEPIVAKIIEYKFYTKLMSTYINPLPEYISGHTGLIHPFFSQTRTATCRLSCSEPNVQQQPSRSEVGRRIREAFVSRFEGGQILAVDYSQAELRILAHMGKEKVFLKAFREDVDVHSAVASEVVYQVAIEDVTKSQRTVCKCFHPDTEVLTRSGWKKILDVSLEEEIVQATPANGSVSLNWVKPLEVFSQKHPSGKLVSLKNEGIDISVTPDHRMLAFNSEGIDKIVMPSELQKQRYWCNAGELDEGDFDIDLSRLRLAVAIQADGHIDSSGAITFGFSKSRKISRIKKLLAGVKYTSGIKNAIGVNNPKLVTWFRIPRIEAVHLSGLLTNKCFDWRWLKLPLNSRKEVLDEISFWDSCKRNDWRMYRYTSVEDINLQVVQALASITGRKTRLSGNNLTIRDSDRTRGGNLATNEFTYTDKVACLSVPSTFVLVRQNGIPVITGQTVNFGLLYGMRAKKLAAELGIDIHESTLVLNKYMNKMEGLKGFLDNSRVFLKENGFTQNYFGRRRYIPKIYSKDQMDQWAGEREGANNTIQSTNADMIRIAMVRIQDYIDSNNLKSKMILQVHDELVFDVHPDELTIMLPEVQKIMETIVEFDVLMKAEGSYADNWSLAH